MVSSFLHGMLLFAILSPWLRKYHLFSADGSGLPGTGGGGGGEGAQYIALPALRPAPAPAPTVTPVETPVVQPPVTIPTEIPPPTPAPDSVPKQAPAQSAPSEAGSTGTGAGPGQGGGTGGGTGGGQGTGTGGGAGPGTGGSERGRPPELRNFPVPPTEGTPRALRGKELVIRCYVGVDGRVERFETDVEIPDRSFRAKIADVVAGFKFVPARDSLGRAVPGVTIVRMGLSNR